ncbi:hypothetical protein AY599_02725 [Leptolyngbya valderiana BDU 20041]|uniref:DUF7219 family protein n=1 Tax=Baaleninema simplex TaxID=2862350 RepID=UPI000347D86D|nr:hypothetical protein [Baaleninema simplex]MDC0835324.1 hypothetical protein [Geitlerinema sp. CS-897]OAB60223.1 hypothetical protein AY599_02725 [Leptolyngbya valderiana BDU 20041]PPT10764.1 Isopropylmalate/homocitrate/citramalate synthase [Geitlerinema sp. FC II]
MDRNQFLYPHIPYRGAVAPEHPEVLLFDANLQEFAQRVSFISNLETGGKLSPEEAYIQVRELWKQLKQSSKDLGIAQKPDSR